MEEKKHHGSNWAKWSIEHRQLVYFFAFLILVMGIFSFKSLGRSEDPSFTAVSYTHLTLPTNSLV